MRTTPLKEEVRSKNKEYGEKIDIRWRMMTARSIKTLKEGSQKVN